MNHSTPGNNFLRLLPIPDVRDQPDQLNRANFSHSSLAWIMRDADRMYSEPVYYDDDGDTGGVPHNLANEYGGDGDGGGSSSSEPSINGDYMEWVSTATPTTVVEPATPVSMPCTDDIYDHPDRWFLDSDRGSDDEEGPVNGGEGPEEHLIPFDRRHHDRHRPRYHHHEGTPHFLQLTEFFEWTFPRPPWTTGSGTRTPSSSVWVEHGGSSGFASCWSGSGSGRGSGSGSSAASSTILSNASSLVRLTGGEGTGLGLMQPYASQLSISEMLVKNEGEEGL